MRRFSTSLFSKVKRKRDQSRSKRNRLGIQLLESRQLLAADSLPIFFDFLGEDGQLTGGFVEIDQTDPLQVAQPVSEFGVAASKVASLKAAGTESLSEDSLQSFTSSTIIDNGPVENRIDIVIVGDGYTVDELDTYQDHIDSFLPGFFAYAPFDTYASFFNVHRVDVISAESGIDNDPTEGIDRNTALDMRYWCANTERLLCTNVSKTLAAAGDAPDVDQVLAVANSSKYGGAGYAGANIGTLAGGNGSTVGLAVHEFGHSFGDLADEYDYGGKTQYSGGEPNSVNLSIEDEATMAANQTKWHRWLPDSNVGTFEGGGYSETGIYRPTYNSMMRNLGRPFEQVNSEQLIFKAYEQVRPIDDATASGTYDFGEVFFVDPVDPVGNPLDIQWSIDGQPLPGATGPQLDTSTLSLDVGLHTVSVEVVDNTLMVRDEAKRASLMTQQKSWTLDVGSVSGPLATLSGTQWDDVNRNGFRDEGEAGLGGWSVYLDFNENGELDDGEPVEVTDAEGDYTFSDLQSSDYVVAVQQQPDYRLTYPHNDTIASPVVTRIDLTSPSMTLSSFLGDEKVVAGGLDVDMYSLVLDQGQRINIDIDAATDGSDLDSVLTLFDSEGNVVASNDDAAGPGEQFGLDSFLDFTAEIAGTYFVGVSSFPNFDYDPEVIASGEFGSTGPYELSISLEEALPPGDFQIEVVFSEVDPLTPSQQAIFTDAANRWAQIIVGDLPDVAFANGEFVGVDDVRITASAPEIDGVGQVLGQAGPRLLRNGSLLPFTGIMEFDSADLASLENSGQLQNVILHEMGHVLGLGTIWDLKGLLDSSEDEADDRFDDPRYTGAGATSEYNDIFGVNEGSVPVENNGGPGTRLGHWDESDLRNGLGIGFENELMSGFLDPGTNPISRITVAQFADLGYEVNLDAADPYEPVLNPPQLRSASGPPLVQGRFLALTPDETALLEQSRPEKEPLATIASKISAKSSPELNSLPSFVANATGLSNPGDGVWEVSVQVGNDLVGLNFGNRFTPDQDFGDAPPEYPTTIANDGASHVPSGPRLGNLRDAEFEGFASFAAQGDNNDGVDDEDGVMFGVIANAGSAAGLNLDVQNLDVQSDTQGLGTAFVDAWIDFNSDGDWDDDGEKILDSVAVIEGLQTLNYQIPVDTSTGETFARVRISSEGGLPVTGAAADGEVEDHLVTIVSAPAVQSVIVNPGQATRSEITSIEVKLDGDVPVSASDFVLRNTTTDQVVTGLLVDRNSDENVTTATLRFTGGPSVSSSNVSGLLPTLNSGIFELRYLPSETNETSQPIEEFFRTYGDDDGDNVVGLNDFSAFRSAFGKTFDVDTPGNGFNSGLDADRDGLIGLADFAEFRANFGQ